MRFIIHPSLEALAGHRELTAAGLELALGAVPVQDEIGRHGAGEQRSDFPEAFPHFAGRGRRFSA